MFLSLIIQIPNVNASKVCFSPNAHSWTNLIQIKSSQTRFETLSCPAMGFGLENSKPNKLLL